MWRGDKQSPLDESHLHKPPGLEAQLSPRQKKVHKIVSIDVIIKILKTREKEKNLGSSQTGNVVQRTRGGDSNLRLLPEVKDASIAGPVNVTFKDGSGCS